MKKIIAVATAASLLSLAACGDADDVDEGDTVIVEDDDGAATTATTDPAMTTTEGDGDGVRVGVDENGMQADVDDGTTSVRVDADGNPSAEVEID